MKTNYRRRLAGLISAFSFLLTTIPISPIAQAGSLSDYKNQKHQSLEPESEKAKPSGPQVPCDQAYTQQCQAKCSSSDQACLDKCSKDALAVCQKKQEEDMALALKIGALFLPAIGTFFDQPRYIAEKDLQGETYDFFWNYPSFYLDLGGGWLEQGTKAVSTTAQYRYDFIGASATASYLTDRTTSLAELDFGPTIYICSQHISAGLQPSVIGSSGNGTNPQWGYGLRTVNTLMLDQFYINWNPLLGWVNKQWLFHLRAGVGYRFTPSWGLSLAYEYRSVVDPQSLSSASISGLFAYLTYRIN